MLEWWYFMYIMSRVVPCIFKFLVLFYRTVWLLFNPEEAPWAKYRSYLLKSIFLYFRLFYTIYHEQRLQSRIIHNHHYAQYSHPVEEGA